MSDCLLVHTLQVCTQGLLALQEDSTDVTGYCWSLVQSLEVLFQAVVVLEYLPTVGALILLASFCQQDRTFRVAALEVVYQVFRVMGDSLPVQAKLSVNKDSLLSICLYKYKYKYKHKYKHKYKYKYKIVSCAFACTRGNNLVQRI